MQTVLALAALAAMIVAGFTAEASGYNGLSPWKALLEPLTLVGLVAAVTIPLFALDWNDDPFTTSAIEVMMVATVTLFYVVGRSNRRK